MKDEKELTKEQVEFRKEVRTKLEHIESIIKYQNNSLANETIGLRKEDLYYFIVFNTKDIYEEIKLKNIQLPPMGNAIPLTIDDFMRNDKDRRLRDDIFQSFMVSSE